MKLIDITNKRYNRLLVISYCGSSKWYCLCDCGKPCVVAGNKLKSGHTQSCGCVQKEKTKQANSKHNDCGKRLHNEWLSMKARCNNPHNKYYNIYGGRGIKVCDKWNKSYLEFKNWALNNGVKEGLSIDRINPSGNYEPSNCRWATTRQQSLNRRDTIKIQYQGKEYTLVELSEMLNIDYATLWARLKVYNFNIDKLLDTQKHIIKDKTPKSGERYIYQSKNGYSVQIHKKYYGIRNSLENAIILRDKILEGL